MIINPDATAIWRFREALVKACVIKELFDTFDRHLAVSCFAAVALLKKYDLFCVIPLAGMKKRGKDAPGPNKTPRASTPPLLTHSPQYSRIASRNRPP